MKNFKGKKISRFNKFSNSISPWNSRCSLNYHRHHIKKFSPFAIAKHIVYINFTEFAFYRVIQLTMLNWVTSFHIRRHTCGEECWSKKHIASTILPLPCLWQFSSCTLFFCCCMVIGVKNVVWTCSRTHLWTLEISRSLAIKMLCLFWHS